VLLVVPLFKTRVKQPLNVTSKNRRTLDGSRQVGNYVFSVHICLTTIGTIV